MSVVSTDDEVFHHLTVQLNMTDTLGHSRAATPKLLCLVYYSGIKGTINNIQAASIRRFEAKE